MKEYWQHRALSRLQSLKCTVKTWMISVFMSQWLFSLSGYTYNIGTIDSTANEGNVFTNLEVSSCILPVAYF